MRGQTTLQKSTSWIQGRHLDRDGRSCVRFCPAARDEGILFVRTDLPGQPEIVCSPANLRSMPRWTALEQDGVDVHHTEHVLAALAACGVDNVRVEVDADRIPMTGGGSTAAFVEALRRAGLATLDAPRRVFVLREPFFFLDGQRTTGEMVEQPSLKDGRYVVGIPADRFSISYVFHWSHLETLPIGVAEYESGEGEIDEALITARSYLVETETQHVRQLLGPVQAEVLMLYPDCPPSLAQEAARHKIMDFLGDFRILGRPVLGRFTAFRTGHRIHHNLVRHLHDKHLLDLKEG